MSYIPQSAQIGGRTFRGAWKPYGYDKAPPTSQYQQVNPMYKWGGRALGFGATIARNWETVGPALSAGANMVGTGLAPMGAGAAVGGAVGGVVGGPAGAVAGAEMGMLV